MSAPYRQRPQDLDVPPKAFVATAFIPMNIRPWPGHKAHRVTFVARGPENRAPATRCREHVELKTTNAPRQGEDRGTESIANTMSLISIAMSARNIGVACHLPAIRTKKWRSW